VVLSEYIESRQKEGAKNRTINRELACLQSMFNLGREHRKVSEVPVFPHLEERTVPKGYLEDGRYKKLVDTFPNRDVLPKYEQASTGITKHRN
jgi:hypothetical protein